MPRRDGLPTNNEMLEQFSQKGRDIFVAALEHGLAYKMPDAYKGKKLGHIVLEITHESEKQVEGFPHAVTSETLSMGVVSLDEAQYCKEDHISLRGTEVAHAIGVEALFLSDIILDDSFDPRIIGMRGVDTSYVARMAGTNRTRHVGSFKERPAKQSIAAGLFLEGQVDQYVHSTEFEIPASVRRLRDLLHSSDDDYLSFSHRWLIPYRADLRFNGYESSDYLNDVLAYATRLLQNAEERLSRLLEMGVPESLTEHEVNRIIDLKCSIASAKSALEKQ